MERRQNTASKWIITNLWVICGSLLVDSTHPFLLMQPNSKISTARRSQGTDTNTKTAKVGDLLSYLPTPSLLVELSLIEKLLQENSIDCSVDTFLADPTKYTSNLLEDCGAFFIHTRVTSTKKRDAILQTQGSGKSLPVCDVDTPYSAVVPVGAYLGLGLANHHVGGYYWARSMGIGASLPAHGIYFGLSSGNEKDGELFWKKRGPGDVAETTEESSNSNDGKRSEWVDFLTVGDTVQLVPYDPVSILVSNSSNDDSGSESQQQVFKELVGLRRAGRPLGADPIVEKIWTQTDNAEKGLWAPQ